MQSLPLASLLMDALPHPKPTEKRNMLRVVSELSTSEVRIVAHEFALGLERMLVESVNTLKKSFDTMDKNMHLRESKASVASKFSVPTEMKCGTIEDFHHGLVGRIGDVFLSFP